MADSDAVLKRHEGRRSKRSIEEKAWRDIATFLRPDDVSFEARAPTTSRHDAEIFDSTPLYANDAFAGGVFAQMSNPANRWFEVTPPDPDLARWGPVKAWTWAAANVMYGSLKPTASTFYAQAPAVFADMGAFGFGNMSQEELVGQRRIANRSIPIGQTFLDVDAEGEVDTVDNAFMWTGRQMKQFFGPATPAAAVDEREYLIVHSVYPNPDYDPRRLGTAFMRDRGCYVSPDLKDLFVEGGYGQLPYHIIGWSRRGGRAYPRGPGHNARADMNTLNEIERSDLVATQFAAEPPLLLKDEDVLSAADVVPNAMLYGAVSDKGQALAQYLERQAQWNPTKAKADQKRASIQLAFKFSIMQLLSRPQMTLGEFQGWQLEELRSMAPNLVQVQMGLGGFLARRYAILDRMGLIPPAPPELANIALNVEFVSPLDKLQKADEGKTVLTLHEGVERMAITNPEARDMFDVDVGVRVLAGSLYAVPGIIRDEKAVAAIRDARGRAQAQQDQLTQAGQAAEVAAVASHAAQAITSARQRGKAA